MAVALINRERITSMDFLIGTVFFSLYYVGCDVSKREVGNYEVEKHEKCDKNLNFFQKTP